MIVRSSGICSQGTTRQKGHRLLGGRQPRAVELCQLIGQAILLDSALQSQTSLFRVIFQKSVQVHVAGQKLFGNILRISISLGCQVMQRFLELKHALLAPQICFTFDEIRITFSEIRSVFCGIWEQLTFWYFAAKMLFF